MQVSKSSANFSIIDSGEVILYSRDADLSFRFEAGPQESYNLRLTFREDGSGLQRIQQEILPGFTGLNCYNFQNMGAGTSTPYEFASFYGRKMYISFWSYVEGAMANMSQIRSVKYTIYIQT